MKSLIMSGLFAVMATGAMGSEAFLKSLKTGKTYTVEQVENDSKNRIPLMREKMCFVGDYMDAYYTLMDWAQRQFGDYVITSVPPETHIVLNSYYRECIEVDTTADLDPGESYPCATYGERIENYSADLNYCQ